WYVKETNDIGILEEPIAYYDSDEKSSVITHMKCALQFTATHLGTHGLPLLGFADWNDTVNLSSGAESVFTACLYGFVLKEAEDLFRKIDDYDYTGFCSQQYIDMSYTVQETAWDGKWFIRYFDEAGKPIGSVNNSKGKIYANAQSWPVICGFASDYQAKVALDSVDKLLATEFGCKLSWPGYDCYDRSIGGVSSYPPGAKENGGIFMHANPWMVIANLEAGNIERAYRYFQAINPASKNEMIERYECEPYVFPQNVLGDEHPQFGLARNTWLTGSASWALVCIQRYMFGVQPFYDHLKIEPNLPEYWKECCFLRRFQNKRYKMRIKKIVGIPGWTVDKQYR
ncbi:MAG: GH36-type glycosyl hydrolase domain-containing protein, partial [Spirochaetia bacterium]